MVPIMPPLGEWTTDAPWKSRSVCLILVAPDDLPLTAVNVGDKRALLAQYTPSFHRLLVAWGGQWSTTARIAMPEDVAAIRAALG